MSFRKPAHFFLLSLALGFGICAHAADPTSGSSRLAPKVVSNPISQADEEKPKKGYYPQADAFEVAGEQASYLGAYQLMFGPYGQTMNKAERDKKLRETSKAIDDCVNGRPCKEELVLKAMVQYNMGQEVKRMMLTNSTNREKMRSLEDLSEGYLNRPNLKSSDIAKSLSQGKTFDYETAVTKEHPKPTKEKREAEISRQYGSARPQIFSVDEKTVRTQVDENLLKDGEILGETFVKEFGVFMNTEKSRTEARDDARRFYKYIPAREGKVFTIDQSGGNTQINQERFTEVSNEQNAKGVRDLAERHLKKLEGAKISAVDDKGGKKRIGSENFDPKEMGVGEFQKVDESQFSDIKFDDINNNKELDQNTKESQKIARVLNSQFEKSAREQLASRAPGRSIASAGSDLSHVPVQVTLSPDTFGEFLDEIWPPAAKR